MSLMEIHKEMEKPRPAAVNWKVGAESRTKEVIPCPY